MTTPGPTFVTVAEWCRISGMRRTSTFKAMRDGKLAAIKPSRRKVFIDAPAGMAWLRSMARVNDKDSSQ